MRGLIFSMLIAAMGVLVIPGCAESAPAPLSHAGKTVLVTGSTDGLGRAVARALAAEGAHVIVHGRTAEGGQSLVDEITRSGVGSASFHAADFTSLQAVRDFADTVARRHPKLDLLVNNAGVAVRAGQPRRVSDDGHELQFQVNYLAGWILVNRLRPNLEAAAPSRVINVSSGSASPIDFDDIMLERDGAHGRGYGQSKLAQVSMTVALAPSFARQGVIMIALHPATLMATTMVRELGLTPQTDVNEGRDHVMSLIRAPALEAGAFYVEGRPSRPGHPQPYDALARERLMALSTQLTGVAAE
jgi:NAD(P)-dependent dehydrogenase (short-subunit alcohol dehydrogenase family)